MKRFSLLFYPTGASFNVDPRDRPTIHVVMAQIEEIAAASSVSLQAPFKGNVNSVSHETNRQSARK